MFINSVQDGLEFEEKWYQGLSNGGCLYQLITLHIELEQCTYQSCLLVQNNVWL